MVVANLNTADVIVKGTTGYLRVIGFGTNSRDPNDQRPMRIWIEFDNLESGRATRETQRVIRAQKNYPEQWTMLEKVKALLVKDRTNRLQLHRTQFPVVPAEAITVHKSQGSTYTNALVNTFYRAFPRDVLYVACSRATSAAGLHIIVKNNRFVPPKPLRLQRSDNELRVELERERSKYLDLEFASLSQRNDNGRSIQLISHNVQSLRAHIDQVVNDPSYLSSDILLFNETWTLPNDEQYSIPGFTLVSRIDGPPPTPCASGSCCYVKNRMVDHIEATSARRFVSGQHSVSVSTVTIAGTLYCSVYASPCSPNALIIEALDFAIATEDAMYFVIAGDFNIRFDAADDYRVHRLTHYFKPKNIVSAALLS